MCSRRGASAVRAGARCEVEALAALSGFAVERGAHAAYKAETNFVDIVPQTKRLRLSLNMHFHELHDPRGMAKDVTNLGRWGNGDVEVGLVNPEQLPYVMGLVRQAFEKQMGNAEAEACR
jgi:predicted transport protein